MTAQGDRLPDDAVVVRCGLPPFTGRLIYTVSGAHSWGSDAFAARATAGLTIQRFTFWCRRISVRDRPPSARPNHGLGTGVPAWIGSGAIVWHGYGG
jgi:hypothetical protein